MVMRWKMATHNTKKCFFPTSLQDVSKTALIHGMGASFHYAETFIIVPGGL